MMYRKYIKRLLDFFLSGMAIAVLSPVFFILIITGAMMMRGNPFFVQKRPGRKEKKTGEEKIISVIKFRTMTNEKDENGELLPDEKRLNGYGKFLRSTSLDELPQLLNIFIGDLALIGPRPLLVKYLPLYSAEQRKRHDVRPGLTGYAQVHGRNAITWEEKFKLDVWYTEHVTFSTDVKIFFDTVKTVLRRDGIHSENTATMEEFKGQNTK